MLRGPGVLFASWVLHDIEEALAFPSTTEHLAELTGIDALRMNTKQSAAAIGLVGAVPGRRFGAEVHRRRCRRRDLAKGVTLSGGT